MTTRRASHAGSWYVSNGSKLSEELASWLDGAQVTCGAARAIIAPHAGYSYSGPTAAWAYKHINVTGVHRIFLLGPSHHVYSPRCSLTTCAEYNTPLGSITIDLEMCNTLRATGMFDDMTRKTDEDEHSLEMHLPYIFHVMRGHPFSLVPILVGSLSEADEAKYGRLFAEHLSNVSVAFRALRSWPLCARRTLIRGLRISLARVRPIRARRTLSRGLSTRQIALRWSRLHQTH